MKFQPGQIYATVGAAELPQIIVFKGLTRHVQGDWGDISESDWQANKQALQHGGSLLSSYKTPEGRKFWIMTEPDRSSTTILLPEEY